MTTRVPIIDLFAGAGGIGIGVTKAGGDLKLSVELDEACCETLKTNSSHHPGQVIQGDVAAFSGRELRRLAGLSASDPLIVVGGPPCQPFSKAAYWTDPGNDAAYRRARAEGFEAQRPKPITRAKRDERRDLVTEFLNRIVEANADGFLFENVRSILHPRNRRLAERFIAQANCAGYKTTMIVANSAQYGVPQLRERVIILGSRWAIPTPPAITHKVSRSLEGDLLPPMTAGEAISKFDKPNFFEPEEVVSGRWAEQLAEIPPGMNYKALTAWAGHPKPKFVAETKFWSFLLKLSPKLPSWTIAASPGPWVGPFHWNGRRLRTAELAGLQTFPADYVFTGSRRERVRQIGNAAPPLLIQRMAESLIKTTFASKVSKRVRAGAA